MMFSYEEVKNLIDKLNPSEIFPDQGIVGESIALKSCLQKLERYAHTVNLWDAKNSTEEKIETSNYKMHKPLLIYGETGTGKDLLVRKLRTILDKRSKIVEYNHAYDDINKIPEANGEVLFIDEFQSFPKDEQTKLNSIVEYGRIQSTGTSFEKNPLDIIIVISSNRDFKELIEEKSLNEDFYYRSNTFIIDLPPLRERKEDIPLIIEFYLQRFCQSYSTSERSLKTNFTTDAVVKLINHNWNGNIRELENKIHYLFVNLLLESPHFIVEVEHLDLTSPYNVPEKSLLGHRFTPEALPTDDTVTIKGSSQSVLLIATEWESKYGGVSTFNRELCKSISRAGHKVCCLVPEATKDERESAKIANVELVTAIPIEGNNNGKSLFRPAMLPYGFIPDIIIGHDRITGGYAQAQMIDFFPKTKFVLFIHTAPGEIEWYKPRIDEAYTATEIAEERQTFQRELARNACLVAAVGPKLSRETEATIHNLEIPLIEFNPGLSELKRVSQPLKAIYCLLLGRAEDDELKGLDIAARALGQLSEKHPFSSGIKPELIIRGATRKTGDKLQAKLKDVGGINLYVRVKEYSSQIERVSEDIQCASVVLMPSRREGFGLVGLEAISAGIPALISSESGLGELIKNELPTELSSKYVIKVTGDIEIDSQTWATAIESILINRNTAFAEVVEIQSLLDKHLSWKKSVDELFQALAKI